MLSSDGETRSVYYTEIYLNLEVLTLYLRYADKQNTKRTMIKANVEIKRYLQAICVLRAYCFTKPYKDAIENPAFS